MDRDGCQRGYQSQLDEVWVMAENELDGESGVLFQHRPAEGDLNHGAAVFVVLVDSPGVHITQWEPHMEGDGKAASVSVYIGESTIPVIEEAIAAWKRRHRA